MLDHDRGEAWQALDGDSGLTDEVRQQALGRLAEGLASVADRIALLDDLRAAAHVGQLTGFVRKDARALLGGGGAADNGG